MLFRVQGKEISLSHPDREVLFKAVEARFVANDGFALATLNLDHLVKLRGDQDFAEAYAAQDFVVADGNPIVWLSRLSGQNVKLVAGADMVLPLAKLAAQHGVKVALFGATQKSLSAAADDLKEKVPALEIVASIAPRMGFDPSSAEAGHLLHELHASGAGLVFLAIGAPKQEIFAARGRSETPGLGFASIGAGLDFHAGAQKRAPRWIRRLALEWVWRMARAPGRLGPRYAKCLAILPGLVFEALRQRNN
ncbi:glycosyltransferase [Rhodobacteraceae bacterium 63075]|nr:glycosyltransferase [Rhodobacteraceae bacterium 63075]